MTVLLDTSAFLAMLNVDDNNHSGAKKEWGDLINSDRSLVSHNYVLIESFALIQRRMGNKAVRVFEEDILPLINIEWIGERMHKSAVSALFAAGRRNLSLVDCVSFEVMRTLGIKKVFTFDSHFKEQGFHCVP
jgi:predicted nucleic acid-binding protein